MSTVQEIERAIATLTAKQLNELYTWLDQHHPQPIDAHLADGLESGRFDIAIERALDEDAAGEAQPI